MTQLTRMTALPLDNRSASPLNGPDGGVATRGAGHQAMIRPGHPGWAPVTCPEDMVMLEALVLIGLIIGGLTALDVVAARLGVDSHRTEHVDWTSPEPILWL